MRAVKSGIINEMEKIIAENRKARFDYEIQDTIEAGIELLGFEVKSAKAGRMNLAGSHAFVRNNQAWLINSQIPPYQPKNTQPDYDPSRTRRLLLHKDEIAALTGKIHDKLSLIPLRAYTKKNIVKVELAIARPRKKQDKREFLKKRTAEREMRRVNSD